MCVVYGQPLLGENLSFAVKRKYIVLVGFGGADP